MFHYLVKGAESGVVRDLYDPKDGFNAANWSVTKSSYGLSVAKSTWIGSLEAGGEKVAQEEIVSGSWSRSPDFITDTGEVRGGRYLDTSGPINIVSFSKNTETPTKLTIYTSQDDVSSDFYQEEWESYGPFSSSDEIDIIDSGRYVIFDFDFGANPAPEDFEAYIRVEIDKPIMAPLYSSTRQAVDKYPSWMSIGELPSPDSGVVESAEDNIGASIINAIAGEWNDDIQRKISYAEFKNYINTANSNVLAWGYRVDGLPDFIHSIKGDGIELARTHDFEEFKEAYSLFEVDEDTIYQVIDHACFVDYENKAVYTLHHYDSLEVNGELDLTDRQEPYHLWNEFDELGLFVGLDRLRMEGNEDYRERILDVYRNRGSVGVEGLKNVLRRELGLIKSTNLLASDPELQDIQFLTIEDIERDPKYFDPDGLPAKDENGAYPFIELVKEIASLFPSTWGNFRWGDALWDASGEDYAGYSAVPYRYDANLAPEKYLQSGVGDGDDLYIHSPDSITGAEHFEWTLKAVSRTRSIRPEYSRLDFTCDITPYGQYELYDNPLKTIWLTVEVVTTGSESYYLPFEISAKSDVDFFTLDPTPSSWGSVSIFSESGNKTLPGFKDINGVLYGESPIDAAKITMGSITDVDLDFTQDNLSFTLSVDYSRPRHYEFSGNYTTTQDLIDELNENVLGVVFDVESGNLVVESKSKGTLSALELTDISNPGSSGLQEGIDIVNSEVDPEDVEASIPSEDIATIKLHNGKLEYGILRHKEVEDTFKVWFSHQDDNYLESTSAEPIEFAFSGQFCRIMMESKVTESETQPWSYDSFSYDVTVNGKPPYDEPVPAVIEIPEVSWREDVVSRGYKIQLKTTFTRKTFQGEEIKEYGVMTQTEKGDTWFIPSDVLLVNDQELQWNDSGQCFIDDSWTEITFSSTNYGLFPSEALYPDEELYPQEVVSYPIPNHEWAYDEHYLVDGDNSVIYATGVVDENGPWRYGKAQKPGNMNPLLSTMESLRVIDFGIDNSDTEVLWVTPELKDPSSKVVLWTDSRVVWSEDYYFKSAEQENCIKELKHSSGLRYFEPFNIYARIRSFDSEWYPKINSGHFYDRGQEYYLYASKKEESTRDAQFVLDEVSRQGAPLSVTGERVGSALILEGNSYASIESINLLTTEEAHVTNFTNQWFARYNSVVSSNDSIEPLFGSNVLYVATHLSVPGSNRFSFGISRDLPVEEAQEYTFSCSMRAVQAKGFRTRIRIIWSTGLVSYSSNEEESLQFDNSDWIRFSHSAISPVGAVTASVVVDIFSNEGYELEDGDAVYVDALMFTSSDKTVFTPSLNATGDLDIRTLAYVDDRSDSLQTTLVSKGSAYRFYMTPTGYLKFEYSDGSDTFISQSTTQLPSDSGMIWLRVFFRVDIGGFRNQVRFLTSQDGEIWTTLGTPVTRTQSELTVLEANTHPLTIGAKSDGTAQLYGAIVKLELRDGLNGPVIACSDWSTNGPWDTESSDSKVNDLGQNVVLNNNAFVYWHHHSPFVAGSDPVMELRQTAFLDTSSDAVKFCSNDYVQVSVANDHSIYLPYSDVYDVEVSLLDDTPIDADSRSETNQIKIYDANVEPGEKVNVKYTPRYSYNITNDYVDEQTGRQCAVISFDTDADTAGIKQYDIVYEGSYYDPATLLDLPLNPLYSSQSEGFVFLSHQDYPLSQVRISVSPSTITADGEDYAMVSIETFDHLGNPKPNQELSLSVDFGALEFDEIQTDEDGFASVLLFSEYNSEIEYKHEATIIADGGFVSEASFYINPAKEKSKSLIAITSAKDIPADGLSYNIAHGQLLDENYNPIPDRTISWRKKRSIKELFTEDREGILFSIPESFIEPAFLTVRTPNLLDAGTANMHYQKGGWDIVSDWTTIGFNEVHSVFGNASLVATRHDNIGAIILKTQKIEVEESQEYTWSLSSMPSTTARSFRMEIRWLDNSDTLISTTEQEFPQELGEWVRGYVSSQAPIGSVNAELLVRWIGCAPSEQHYLDAACFSASSDPSFYPAWNGLSDWEIITRVKPNVKKEMSLFAFYDEKLEDYSTVFWFDSNNILRISTRMPDGSYQETMAHLALMVEEGLDVALSLAINENSGSMEIRVSDKETNSWKRVGVMVDVETLITGNKFVVGPISFDGKPSFDGSIGYVAIRDRSKFGSLIFEGDFTETGPWSPSDAPGSYNIDVSGLTWEFEAEADPYEGEIGFIAENDSHGEAVTDQDGRFNVGPFTSSDVVGHWFVSVESSSDDIGDVVSWFEYPVVTLGVESPDSVPDQPVRNLYNTQKSAYSNEYKYTASSYHDDATIEENSSVDIVWLPPVWYPITAYEQMQLGIDGHNVAKSV